MTSLAFRAAQCSAAQFAGAFGAVMTVEHVANPVSSAALDVAKRTLETGLRGRWSEGGRDAMRTDPVLAAYDAYYKRFGQNYHVRMQIESIALKGKTIPSRAALVEAMFMAELETGVLAAVHDLNSVTGAVEVFATDGTERYIRYDGAEERCKPGDMAMRDDVGILTSVIQGPTTLARVTPETTAALFCLYAVAGVDEQAIGRCLDAIERFTRLATPGAGGFSRVILRSSG